MWTHILGKSYENVKLAEMSKAESPGYDGVIRKFIWSMLEVSARLTRRKGKIGDTAFMQLMRRKGKGEGMLFAPFLPAAIFLSYISQFP